jgi:hypothetical protein
MDKKPKEFLRELKSLLDKYNANISFAVSDSSDTYGLSGENLEIRVDGKVVMSVCGWSMDANDLYHCNR